ncbi:hypothetical protein Trydic_g9722 [Trypoxylus dichotomus]
MAGLKYLSLKYGSAAPMNVYFSSTCTNLTTGAGKQFATEKRPKKSTHMKNRSSRRENRRKIRAALLPSTCGSKFTLCTGDFLRTNSNSDQVIYQLYNFAKIHFQGPDCSQCGGTNDGGYVFSRHISSMFRMSHHQQKIGTSRVSAIKRTRTST